MQKRGFKGKMGRRENRGVTGNMDTNCTNFPDDQCSFVMDFSQCLTYVGFYTEVLIHDKVS